MPKAKIPVFKFNGRFDYSKYNGDIFPLSEFLDMVNSGSIISHDGTLGEVIVDKNKTDIRVKCWSYGNGNTTLEDLARLEKMSIVEIRWCNR